MSNPVSNWYEFEERLSATPQIETWLAVEVATGHRCVVKKVAPEADADTINAILDTSYRCQRELRAPNIINCRRKRLEKGQVLVEYPLLDRQQWHPLTPERFWSHFPDSLIQVCQVVDYLHMIGLVHGDLKLENFLCRPRDDRLECALVDLDFLCRDNSKPGGRVFGTPDHIAPEIIANDRVVTQSDNYSLGIALQRYLAALDQLTALSSAVTATDRDRLTALIRQLCEADYVTRPDYLLATIRGLAIADTGSFETAQKSLLGRLLFTRWLIAGRSRTLSADNLRIIFITQCKILGASDELFPLFASVLAKSPRRAIGIFGRLMSKASVSRHADHWHLQLDDDSLLTFYQDLDRANGSSSAAIISENHSLPAIREKLNRVSELADAGRLEQAYLTGRQVLHGARSTAADVPAELLFELHERLAYMARCIGRLGDAGEHTQQLLDIPVPDPTRQPKIIDDAVAVNFLLGRYDRAEELIDRRLEQVDLETPGEMDLNLYRIKGWLCASHGDYDRGERIFEEVIEKATRQGYGWVLMLTHYSIGVMHWRRGRAEHALKCLKKSLGVARKFDITHQASAVLSTMAVLYSDLADYETAAKHGKMAIRAITEPHEAAKLPAICVGVSYAYTRLADFTKAEYWVQRCFDLSRRATEGGDLLTFYLIEGYLYLNRSEPYRARRCFHRGLKLVDDNAPAKLVGQLHFNLADLALQRGDAEACRREAGAARRAFAQVKDEASDTEVQMLLTIWDLVYEPGDSVDDAVSLVRALLDHKCRYSAARLLFHVMVASPTVTLSHLGDLAGSIEPLVAGSSVPLFKAVHFLMGGLRRDRAPANLRLPALKLAVQETLGGKARFASLLLHRAISDLYLDKKKFRHAEKHLSQAVGLSQALSNPVLTASTRKLLDRSGAQATDQAPLVESFHGVSEILHDIANPTESYQRLLQFALDQTGAERAVLLLQRHATGQLYVAASLNCDRESEEEITSISSNVASRTIADVDPMFVDNAIADKRTRDYGSIVAHNILSVACIPLVHGDEQQGVLYLDHNTLPSLFSSSDIKYITAISNFLSTVISAVQSFHGLSQANVQLRQDLSRLGDTGSFVTGDDNMMRLLERLPEIAQVDVPVLVQGESGTGKEIICEMLHRGSRRSATPMTKLNCAAISPTMVESELFGVAKNAATGVAEHEGKLAAANGSTLFLDEIADMPMDMQAKLLRVVEYQQFEKVGSNRPIHTDIRFVYATNQDLIELMKQGKFRNDLYYRINTIIIEIPPLRERPGDVELLLDHFLDLFSAGRPRPQLSPAARAALLDYCWPGNVRELKNLVERCCILYGGQAVDLQVVRGGMVLPECESSFNGSSPVQDKHGILQALKRTGWNQTKAAGLLGMTLSTLRRRMKKYGLSKGN